jgi:hypothetical protein
MPDDKAPRVEEHHGKVLIWGSAADGDESGLRISVPAAVTTIGRLMRQVSAMRGDNLPALPVGNVAVDVREIEGEDLTVRLVFEIEGAPLAVYVDLTQFAEIIAGFTAVSRELDRVQKPRGDG